MIGLFKSTATKEDLTLYNGDFILDSICIKCEESEELNGDYGLDCTFLITKDLEQEVYENIEVNSYLKVDGEYGTEYFEIAQARKSSNNGYIDVFARQISTSECLSLWCEDVRPTNQNGSGALNWIFNNAKGRKWLEVTSNIGNKGTAYYINKTVYEALFNTDNSFLDVWGGEVTRRGFRLSINAPALTNRGVSIRSRKNLRGLEQETNLNSLITRIYPKGFDGISIPEKFIDSPNAGKYSKAFPKEIKFEDVKVKSEDDEEGFDTLEQAQEELRRRVRNLFEVERVDEITATYRIDFIDLSKTEEYKNYQILEKTWLGDIVNVHDEVLNLDINVRVIKRTYDCLKKERTKTELSNKDIRQKPPTIAQIYKALESLPATEEVLSEAKKQATSLINAGLKDSHVIVRQDEILIMDTKDINTATKVWRWNLNGWGYSKTGYYGTFELAATMDGVIVADFVKTGKLESLNGYSWLDMNSGNFDFARGALTFDGNTLSMIGKLTNVLDGFGVEIARGGLTFSTTGEVSGGIRSSSFPDDRNINGISIVSTKKGDYIDIGYTEDEDFSPSSQFYSRLRITNSKHPLTGDYVGIQLKDNARIDRKKSLQFESSDNDYPHQIFNTGEGDLYLSGNGRLRLGYRYYDENISALDIKSEAEQYGNQILINKQTSFQGNKQTFVSDIFTTATAGRYLHEGWVGSIERTAKRISNLNVFYDSGWYAYGEGTNGSPTNWGVMLHIKLNASDFGQIVLGMNNVLYTRCWTNNNWTAWVSR